MGQEIKEQLKGIVSLPAIAEDALKHIEAQEKVIVTLTSDLGEEETKNSKLESRVNELEEELEEAQELSEDVKPENLYDEMKSKILTRLYKNLTLEGLEKIESYAKSISKNYID